MFCKNCGYLITEDSKFCGSCGCLLTENKNINDIKNNNYGYVNNNVAENNISNADNNTPNNSNFINTKVNKSKMLAAILSIFFGYFGAHKFYLGYKEEGKSRLWMLAVNIFIELLTALIQNYAPEIYTVFIYLVYMWTAACIIIGVVDAIPILQDKVTDVNGNKRPAKFLCKKK